MLTIAGSGVNVYSLKDVKLQGFDTIVADLNFNNEQNKELIKGLNIQFLPFKEVKNSIKQEFSSDKKVLYVVTGSPMFFSGAENVMEFIKQEIPACEINILHAESSKDYLLRKLGISEKEVQTLSLHGKDPLTLDLTRFVTSKYTFLLCDEKSIAQIAKDTKYLQDDVIFYIGSNLGSNEEKIERADIYKLALELNLEQIKNNLSPFVVLIERKTAFSHQMSEDHLFKTNSGMITKKDKRAITLNALKLKPNLLLWDIGAGSGAVSIDAYKVFKVRTVLFEKNPDQGAFIKENLTYHNVAAAQLFEGDFFDNYKNAPSPDRIFIGGGGERLLAEILTLYNLLNNNGLIVANIIGLENLVSLVNALKNAHIEYKIKSINITDFKSISENVELKIAEPQRTLFQVIINKE